MSSSVLDTTMLGQARYFVSRIAEQTPATLLIDGYTPEDAGCTPEFCVWYKELGEGAQGALCMFLAFTADFEANPMIDAAGIHQWLHVMAPRINREMLRCRP